MDRLSRLPEDVIGLILSFLPTASSFARTSILAKQWRFLWTRLLALGFTVGTNNPFHNTTSIDDDFSSWIDSTRNVRNIVIRLNHCLPLPRRLFINNTLVDLCIIDSGDIRMEAVYNFSALKKLQLVNVGYDSEDSLTCMVYRCPVLEELIVDGMKLNYSRRSSPVERTCGAILLRKRIFDKPSLRYLRLRIRACESLYIWNWKLNSLVEADLGMSEGRFSSSCQLRDFLPIVRDVKRLTLSTSGIETPYYNWTYTGPLSFRNLTELNLRTDWCFIAIFLASAKNLRVLTIHHKVDHNTQCWTEGLHMHTSACWMDHLETVNLFDFEWSTNQEFEMVEFILRKAKVLKTVEIMYTASQCEESDWNHKVEARDRLASFDTLSSTCSIRLRLV